MENYNSQKVKIRKQVADIKSKLSKEAVINRSEKIIDKLCASNEYKRANNILVYVSYNQEVYTHEFINKSIAQGKNIFVPKVEGEKIEFYKIQSFSSLHKGKYGILEPAAELDKLFNTDDGIIIMPGVAFSHSFKRIGYGGGFYDRYLEHRLNLKRIAICFDFQMYDDFNTEDYDIGPEIIITESKLLVK